MLINLDISLDEEEILERVAIVLEGRQGRICWYEKSRRLVLDVKEE